MCQYLASEVHKPFIEIPAATVKETEDPRAARKKVPPSKKASKLTMGSGPQHKASPSATKPDLPPPTPVVSQLMEMGFNRRYIEYAIQTTGSTSPERLINWLIEHQDIEIPEGSVVSPTPATTTATPATPSSSDSTASRARQADTDSSSDTEDSGEEEVDDMEGDGGKFGPFPPILNVHT